MLRASRAFVILILLAGGAFTPSSAHAAVSTLHWNYLFDQDAGTVNPAADVAITDGGTFAVPLNAPGRISINTTLPEGPYFASGQLFFINPDTGEREALGKPKYGLAWTRAGTYELEVYADLRVVTQGPLERLFAWLVPVAHAATTDDPFHVYIETIRFTISDGPIPPPPCCSSVLFLPGIEGSILKDGSDTLWPPTLFSVTNDLGKLELNADGTPTDTNVTVDGIMNTFDIRAAIGPSIKSIPVYRDFSSFMDTLTDDTGDGTIHEWKPFAYDWRFPPEKILVDGVATANGTIDLIQTVEEMASNSKSGKVTIVAHSMGGLLGKALIKELENRGEAHLVDNFIMVASPQLGTPQAVAGLLHGEGSQIGQGFFTLVDKSKARALGQNMETAYDLLPSSRYFDEVSDPVITFATTTPPSQDWRDFAGHCLAGSDAWCINDFAKFTQFITGQGVSRPYPDPADHLTPEILSTDIVDAATNFHNTYDNFTFPASIHVIQIAGWGVDTIKGIKYTQDKGALDYEPLITAEGDNTVVYPSALATSIGENYYLNLFNYNKTNTAADHTTIIDTVPVEEVLKDVLKSNPVSGVDFLSTTRPLISDVSKKLLVSAHSPVTIGVHDSHGNFTGITPGQDPNADIQLITNDIPGSQYLSFGQGKYILLPKDGIYTFEFKGTGSGTATVNVEELSNNTQMSVATYSDVPVTTSTTATLAVNPALPPEQTPLQVDSNGDGTPDATVAPDGYIAPPSTPTIDQLLAALTTSVNSLSIKDKQKTQLLNKISTVQKKIDKQKVKQSIVLARLHAQVDKKAGKGKIDATSASAISTLLDDLIAQSATVPLDPALIQRLKEQINAATITPTLKTSLLAKVTKLENVAGISRSLNAMTQAVTKKGAKGVLSDAEVQNLLNLLDQIQSAI